MMLFPGGKKFAFTFLDDTDNATIEKVKIIYDFLHSESIIGTKSVWFYPPKDNFHDTQYLQQKDYCALIKDLKNKGFEICLHSVGSGKFTRQEIISAFEAFKNIFGSYPRVHANHSNNPDNIYWNPEFRFSKPLSWMYKMYNTVRRKERNKFQGQDVNSACFWGDFCKENIDYIRNYTFNGINTYKYDFRMPWRRKLTDRFSNHWFSSSDGHTVMEFNELLSPENLDKLERENGICIVYTHFAEGFLENGRLNEVFKQRIKDLGSRNGWFVPVSELLDFIIENKANDDYINQRYLLRLNYLWLKDRLRKKYKYGR